MGLSNKIVSKFVKATKNDTSINKKEKTVYGNMVIMYADPDTHKEYEVVMDSKSEQLFYENENGQNVNVTNSDDLLRYVKIDGAGEKDLTPVSGLTSNVNPDQKVIVMIKDHTAIVTGNLDAPAVEVTQVRKEVNRRLSEVSSITEDEINALWESYE